MRCWSKMTARSHVCVLMSLCHVGLMQTNVPFSGDLQLLMILSLGTTMVCVDVQDSILLDTCNDACVVVLSPGAGNGCRLCMS